MCLMFNYMCVFRYLKGTLEAVCFMFNGVFLMRLFYCSVVIDYWR